MIDYFSAILNCPEFKDSFEAVTNLEKELVSLNISIRQANPREKNSLKEQQKQKISELESKISSILYLKPCGTDLQWIPQNFLSALTLFQMQQGQCEKSLELFKEAWRKEILKNGSLQKSNLIKSLEAYNIINLFEFYKTPTVNINILPLFSLFLKFTFTLAKPYLSKDDQAFYICENPIKKDKVFKVPIVSGSTWKGNMRWTAGQIRELNPDKRDDELIKRLFGNEKAEEKQFHCGRLNFYPTFFDKISLEVINPHDRKTKAGTVPIYIESVPAGASGTFSLLYVPFDLMGKFSEEIKQQVTEDVSLVYDSIKEMMLTYGFSAKKSSGFGVIRDEFSDTGFIQFKNKTFIEKHFSNFTSMSQKIEEIKQTI